MKFADETWNTSKESTRFDKKSTHILVEGELSKKSIQRMRRNKKKQFIFFTKDFSFRQQKDLAYNCPGNCTMVFCVENWHQVERVSKTIKKYEPKQFGICHKISEKNPKNFNAAFWNKWFKWVLVLPKRTPVPEWVYPFSDLNIPVFIDSDVLPIRQERI